MSQRSVLNNIDLLDIFRYNVSKLKGDRNMPYSVRLNEEEKKLVDSYCKLHGLSFSEAFKRALLEKIEDEYDVAIADKAYKDWQMDDFKSYPIEDLFNKYDL